MLMVTKFGRMVTYYNVLPPIMSHDTSITWPREFTRQIKCVISSFALGQWTPTMTRWWLIVRAFHRKSQMTPCVATWDHVTNQIGYISICSRPMTNNLGKVVTYCQRVQPLKSHERKFVMWQIDKIISPFSQDFWALNLTGFGWLEGGGSERKRQSRQGLLVCFLLFCVS